jgi:hypothetical protein
MPAQRTRRAKYISTLGILNYTTTEKQTDKPVGASTPDKQVTHRKKQGQMHRQKKNQAHCRYVKSPAAASEAYRPDS